MKQSFIKYHFIDFLKDLKMQNARINSRLSKTAHSDYEYWALPFIPRTSRTYSTNTSPHWHRWTSTLKVIKQMPYQCNFNHLSLCAYGALSTGISLFQIMPWEVSEELLHWLEKSRLTDVKSYTTEGDGLTFIFILWSRRLTRSCSRLFNSSSSSRDSLMRTIFTSSCKAQVTDSINVHRIRDFS